MTLKTFSHPFFFVEEDPMEIISGTVRKKSMDGLSGYEDPSPGGIMSGTAPRGKDAVSGGRAANCVTFNTDAHFDVPIDNE